MTVVSVELPDDVAALLGAQAQAEGAQPEDVVRDAVIAHLGALRPEELVGAVSAHLAVQDRDLITGLRGRG